MVYSCSGRSVAIVVCETLDIVLNDKRKRSTVENHDLLGSVVLKDHVTELLDVEQTMRTVNPASSDEIDDFNTGLELGFRLDMVGAWWLMTQYIIFRLDGALYGIEMNKVTGILHGEGVTNVPLSSETIIELVSLYGQITTLIDPHKRLIPPSRDNGETTMMVVVVLDGEALSLVVDSIGDVREADEGDLEVLSNTLSQEIRGLVLGAYKPPDGLLLMLDVERVVAIRQNAHGLEKTKETTVV